MRGRNLPRWVSHRNGYTSAGAPVRPCSTRTHCVRWNGTPQSSPHTAITSAFLTFSHKAAASIGAAHELHAAGLAVLSGHHNGELRVALPTLTLDNHERASTILNTTHPDWGTKRFTRDPSAHGHHTHGTGPNSAVLFASDFEGWVVASWLPTPAEVAAERAAREAYLDENRPGWRSRLPVGEA